MGIKICKDCGEYKEENRDNFGQYKNVRSDGSIKIGYRNQCRKCMAKHVSNYERSNPDIVLEKRLRRQVLSNSADGGYDYQDIIILRKLLGDKCRFCGVPLNGKGQIEHLTPISRGGSHNLTNLSLACHKCNYEKTNKTLEEYIIWRKERGLKIRKVNIITEKPDQPKIKAGRKKYN
ncbi:HNH endonuclease [Spirabiliibacterium falconis]|uniref:HNH endonuclease n=1 Tax=Spirabiliibacterium falconis TaxID=572023 RepID=UPI001AAC4945|nr:HNH endonuclease [Spirabiliibacterium falconis]MBE2894818.1 HNH endonuclease [Spirabiliibacterium falconis]